MQKAAYYENPGLFGGYGYSKATDTYGYGTPHQPYPPPAAANSLDTDYTGSACSIQSSAPLRAPAHKGAELNGSCMRPGTGNSQGGGGGSQPPGLNSEQQPPQPPPPPPTLPPSSPTNPGGGAPAKKAKGGPNASGSSATISKQIFPWMKESRQNSKQKNGCAAAGELRGCPPGPSVQAGAHEAYTASAQLVELEKNSTSPATCAGPRQRGDSQPAEPLTGARSGSRTGAHEVQEGRTKAKGILHFLSAKRYAAAVQTPPHGQQRRRRQRQPAGGTADCAWRGNFVDSMPVEGPCQPEPTLSHPSSASVDYSYLPGSGNHHHGPCDPHPTYTDLSAHHSSQGHAG
ncbi:homeobox protein Hox-D3 [Puma concolor]|uniref:Homeobox protein Hox-D3 n=1 Tax=Puma concolor TaxID=9696 RepID=A0A6P6IA22_PUMCO|nr:homeobox protein Hox-D3 [Puma concolor]